MHSSKPGETIKNVSRGTSWGSQTHILFDTVLELGIPEPISAICAAHFDLMLRWNKVHNLTRITEPNQAAELHYLDSYLPLQNLAQPKRVADLGSGNGLPGVIAAALWPQVPVTLVEVVGKKASFLRMLRSEMQMPNLSIVNARCEETPAIDADLVISRATFPWPELPGFAARHLANPGLLLAYLGKDSPNIEQWIQCTQAQGLSAATLSEYSLPLSKSTRHLASAQR